MTSLAGRMENPAHGVPISPNSNTIGRFGSPDIRADRPYGGCPRRSFGKHRIDPDISAILGELPHGKTWGFFFSRCFSTTRAVSGFRISASLSVCSSLRRRGSPHDRFDLDRPRLPSRICPYGFLLDGAPHGVGRCSTVHVFTNPFSP